MTEETENYNNNNDNNNENSEEKTISDLRDFGFSSRISASTSYFVLLFTSSSSNIVDTL